MLLFLKRQLYPFFCDTVAFFVYPLARLFGGVENTVTVFVYHNVSPDTPLNAAPYMNVAPEVFERQLSALASGKYEVLSAEEFGRFLWGHKALPGGGVLITFDDGFQGFVDYVRPFIEKKRIPVALFVTTGYMGNREIFPWLVRLEFAGEENPKSWRPLKERDVVESECISVGAHGDSHAKLGRMSNDEVSADVSRCRDMLRNLTGNAPVFFAYPQGIAEHGDWTGQTNAVLGECGFEAAFNSHVGRVRPDDDKYSLRRIAVNRYDSPAILKRKIYGAYDWVYYLQRLIHGVTR